MGLRKKISLFTWIITIVSVFATAFLGYLFNYDQTKAYIDEAMNAEAKLITEEVEFWLRDKVKVIDYMANDIEKNDLSLAEIETHLKNVKKDEAVSDLYVGFEDGRFISAIGWLPPEGYDPRIRPWYINARNSDALVFSEPYLDMTSGKIAISIGRKIHDSSGKLLGVIAEDILVDTLFGRMSEIQFHEVGYAFMINDKGYLLAHPDETIKNTDLRKNEELSTLIEQMLIRKEGKIAYRYKGIDKFAVLKEIGFSKWVVGITIPQSHIYQPLNELMGRFVIIFLIISFLSVTFSLTLSKNITRRLNALLKGSVSIARGNYAERIAVDGADEITELSEAFNTMAGSIKQYTDELDSYNNKLSFMVQEAVRKVEETQKQYVETEKIASLSYVVAGVAHEMNTPVGNCIMLASYLEQELARMADMVEGPSVKRSELLRFFEESKDSCGKLVANLELSIGLIEKFKDLSVEKLSSPPEPIDMQELAEGVFILVASAYPDRDVVLDYRSQSRLVLKSEVLKLTKLLHELFSNSFCHGFEEKTSGTVSVAVSREASGLVRIDYEDDGVGFGAETNKNVFVPFYSTKFSKYHNGLGMNVVYNIVKSLGGHIEIAEGREQGVKMTITLKEVEK